MSVKVSIVIPAYNAQETVGQAVDSALKQNFPKQDFEVIVVNDGSTDKTAEVLRSFEPQIKLIDQQNLGATKAANKGFKQAHGEYVIKLDADDTFEPNILPEMVRVLDERPEIDFVYADYYERAYNGEVKIVSPRHNLFKTIAIGIMYRRRKLMEQGFYREEVGFAEYDLLLRTLDKWKGYCIFKPLFYYNRRQKSITSDKQWVKDEIEKLKKLHPKSSKEIAQIREY